MIKIKKALGISAVTLGLLVDLGCTKIEQPEQAVTNRLEGLIKDVQPSFINYGSDISSFPVTFVLFKDDNGTNYSFILPNARGVRKERAIITYQYFPKNEIKTGDLIKNFINESYTISGWVNDIKIKADGLILKDGIEYMDILK